MMFFVYKTTFYYDVGLLVKQLCFNKVLVFETVHFMFRMKTFYKTQQKQYTMCIRCCYSYKNKKIDNLSVGCIFKQDKSETQMMWCKINRHKIVIYYFFILITMVTLLITRTFNINSNKNFHLHPRNLKVIFLLVKLKYGGNIM